MWACPNTGASGKKASQNDTHTGLDLDASKMDLSVWMRSHGAGVGCGWDPDGTGGGRHEIGMEPTWKPDYIGWNSNP